MTALRETDAGVATAVAAGTDARRYTADIDVGGTFTDGFFSDGITAHTAKVLTTPHDLTECFLGCLSRGAAAFDLSLPTFLGRTGVVRLSTTLGTNTLLQHRGPKVGLLVTAGAERSLYDEVSTGDGSALPAAHGLLGAELVRGVDESIDEAGQSVTEPSSDQVLTAVRELIDGGARIIVVSLANSWRNQQHERRIRDIVRERYPVHYLRSVPLQLAHEVTSSNDDHARTNTVLLNAYLHSDLSRGLYRAEDLARAEGMRRPLLIVHAAGGSARVAKTVAVQTLSSGPAVAVRGAAVTARQLGLTHVVTADMGGTSLDVAVLDDRMPVIVAEPVVAGMRIAVPVIATESIGAAGGSIASVVDGELRVGPESAGSAPGPVCYGKGGQRPTVTDANLLLGLLDADGFLGGRMRLDADRARTVVERRLSGPLEVDVETAAAMVRSVVNTAMAGEVRERIEAGGVPASEYTMFAFGGGGPLHACDIAELAGIRTVVGFPYGSVFSAFGSSTVDVWHRYSQSSAVTDAPDRAAVTIADAVTELRRQGAVDMRGEGFAPDEVTESAFLVAQSGADRQEIPLADDGSMEGDALEGDALEGDALEDACARALAQVPNGQLREVVLDVRASMPRWTPIKAETQEAAAQPTATRDIRWSVEGTALATPIVRLDDMPPGSFVTGPAVIDTADTVHAVNPGWTARVSADGNVVLERAAATGSQA